MDGAVLLFQLMAGRENEYPSSTIEMNDGSNADFFGLSRLLHQLFKSCTFFKNDRASRNNDKFSTSRNSFLYDHENFLRLFHESNDELVVEMDTVDYE